MLAYQGIETKDEMLARLAEHYRLDQIIQGAYWSAGKGCAVGCLTHDPAGGHDQFPVRWGIPVELAYLMDGLFELLPADVCPDWPTRIMSAIPVGADLSLVWPRWAHWMLTGLLPGLLPGAEESAAVVEQVADLYLRVIAGSLPTAVEWSEAARAAARAAAEWTAAEWAAAARAAEWTTDACDELVRLVANALECVLNC